MFAGPLPRELKPPGVRVPARRPRGRASPRTSLNPERRVPARALQAPACPRTWTPFAADTQRLAAPPPLAAPPCSLRRRFSPHRPPPCSLRRSPRRGASLTVLLAAPIPSPCRLAHRRCAAFAAPPAALLATVALLHIPLVGIAFLHAQSPRSAQYRRSNGTGVQ